MHNNLQGLLAVGAGDAPVEQRVAEALEECDRAYVLETGRIALSGGASDLSAERLRQAYLGL